MIWIAWCKIPIRQYCGTEPVDLVGIWFLERPRLFEHILLPFRFPVHLLEPLGKLPFLEGFKLLSFHVARPGGSLGEAKEAARVLALPALLVAERRDHGAPLIHLRTHQEGKKERIHTSRTMWAIATSSIAMIRHECNAQFSHQI